MKIVGGREIWIEDGTGNWGLKGGFEGLGGFVHGWVGRSIGIWGRDVHRPHVRLWNL